MDSPKKVIQDLVEDLPEEKLGKIISYIKFIKKEPEPTLILEEDDENEILSILEEDEWYSAEEMEKIVEDKKHE